MSHDDDPFPASLPRSFGQPDHPSTIDPRKRPPTPMFALPSEIVPCSQDLTDDSFRPAQYHAFRHSAMSPVHYFPSSANAEEVISDSQISLTRLPLLIRRSVPPPLSRFGASVNLLWQGGGKKTEAATQRTATESEEGEVIPSSQTQLLSPFRSGIYTTDASESPSKRSIARSGNLLPHDVEAVATTVMLETLGAADISRVGSVFPGLAEPTSSPPTFRALAAVPNLHAIISLSLRPCLQLLSDHFVYAGSLTRRMDSE